MLDLGLVVLVLKEKTPWEIGMCGEIGNDVEDGGGVWWIVL
jgi:hypothetical protein